MAAGTTWTLKLFSLQPCDVLTTQEYWPLSFNPALYIVKLVFLFLIVPSVRLNLASFTLYLLLVCFRLSLKSQNVSTYDTLGWTAIQLIFKFFPFVIWRVDLDCFSLGPRMSCTLSDMFCVLIMVLALPPQEYVPLWASVTCFSSNDMLYSLTVLLKVIHLTLKL